MKTSKTDYIRFRTTTELKRAVEEAAAADNRTMTGFIENVLKKAVAESKKQDGE